MGAGAWVFPIGVVVFLGYLVSFLAGHPATPPAHVLAGDTVTLETTQFYGPGFAAFTTREDLYSTGAIRLSPYGTGLEPEPTTVTIPSTATRTDDSIISQLIGHRLNETFTTPKVPAYYGRFAETKTLDPVVLSFPATVTIRGGDATPQGPFNYTQFVTRWSQTVGHPLRTGDTFQCESGVPWTCRAETVDARSQTISYRRIVPDGAQVSPSLVFAIAPGTPAPRSNLTVRPSGTDQYALRWMPPAGESFVLQQATASWAAGSYRVESSDESAVRVRYAPLSPGSQGGAVPAHLLDQDVWFEITIVRITHPTA